MTYNYANIFIRPFASFSFLLLRLRPRRLEMLQPGTVCLAKSLNIGNGLYVEVVNGRNDKCFLGSRTRRILIGRWQLHSVGLRHSGVDRASAVTKWAQGDVTNVRLTLARAARRSVMQSPPFDATMAPPPPSLAPNLPSIGQTE
jgi:hypothetical protein